MKKTFLSRLILSVLLALNLSIPPGFITANAIAKDYGSIDGVINDLYQVAYDSGELGSAQTSITISGLNGDVDQEYRLMTRLVSNAINSALYLRINNDSGANYGRQALLGVNVAASAVRETNNTSVYLDPANQTPSSGEINFDNLLLYAKSGYVRTAISEGCGDIAATTVSGVGVGGHSWNNTTDNITNLVLLPGETNGIGVGSRIILLKKINAAAGKKFGDMNVKGKVKNAWQDLYKTTLGSAQTSVTISGLDGNTDVVYRLICRHLGGNASDTRVNLQYNGDTTSANYGRQWLYGTSTTVSASRNTASIPTIVYAAQNNLSLCEFIIYAKSGYVRTMIGNFSYSITGTTVTGIQFEGSSWNNTADNITSLVVLADQPSGLGVGTEIVLERLNLN